MNGEELVQLLYDMGRSKQWLADTIDENRTQVVRWAYDHAIIPDEVARWLRMHHSDYMHSLRVHSPPQRRQERTA